LSFFSLTHVSHLPQIIINKNYFFSQTHIWQRKSNSKSF
jgi:hypothetical protein